MKTAGVAIFVNTENSVSHIYMYVCMYNVHVNLPNTIMRMMLFLYATGFS